VKSQPRPVRLSSAGAPVRSVRSPLGWGRAKQVVVSLAYPHRSIVASCMKISPSSYAIEFHQQPGRPRTAASSSTSAAFNEGRPDLGPGGPCPAAQRKRTTVEMIAPGDPRRGACACLILSHGTTSVRADALGAPTPRRDHVMM
jgi:hypothetical protein